MGTTTQKEVAQVWAETKGINAYQIFQMDQFFIQLR